jgi:hypothetical protein
MDVIFENLTGRDFSVQQQKMTVFPAGDFSLSLEVTDRVVQNMNGIRIYESGSRVIGTMPEKISRKFYLVEREVALLCKRDDFLFPDELMRDGVYARLAQAPRG